MFDSMVTTIEALIQFAFVHAPVGEGYNIVVHLFPQMATEPLPDYALLDDGDIIELRGESVLFLYDLEEEDINAMVVRF